MNKNEFIPVYFTLPTATATVDGIGAASLPAPLTPIDFCNEYPNYWLEKHPMSGDTIIVTFIKAYTKRPSLILNGTTYNSYDTLIGGRPVRRPNTY